MHSLSTLIYPLNVLKNIQQSKLGGRYNRPLNIFSIYLSTKWKFNERSVKWNFLRSLISWGIINSTYEYYLTTIRKIIF